MAVEDQVRDLLHTVVPHPPIGLDADTVERSARRRHRRHVALTTLPAVVVVTALVLGGTALLGRSDRPSSVVPTDQAPRWHQVADMPLSPRWLPLVAWTGDEAIVVGGLTGSTAGVGQDATTLADGAAYEPEAGTWRTIAPAPEHLSSVDDTSVLVDDTLVVAHAGRLLAYDLTHDSWRRLPDPPHPMPLATMATMEGLVYALNVNVPGNDQYPVQVLDPATDEWSALPLDDGFREPSLRTLVATPEGLVVMSDGNVAAAELWDGTNWSLYPDSDLQGCCWHWTGDRVISGGLVTESASKQGGFRAFHPAALDPATGTWTALPWLPKDTPTTLQTGGLAAADGPLLLANSWLYDDTDGSFTHVDPPVSYLTTPGLLIGGRTLLAFGGYLPEPGHENDNVKQVQPTSQVWKIDMPQA
jgi:hypothetical protein